MVSCSVLGIKTKRTGLKLAGVLLHFFVELALKYIKKEIWL